jgi:hypothetical protein
MGEYTRDENKMQDINITSANGGKWRRKVRSLLAERVRLSDLQGYIAMPPSDDNPAAMSIAAQVISHASDVFCKLQRGMGTDEHTNTRVLYPPRSYNTQRTPMGGSPLRR